MSIKLGLPTNNFVKYIRKTSLKLQLNCYHNKILTSFLLPGVFFYILIFLLVGKPTQTPTQLNKQIDLETKIKF